jgi:hypothetical protein
MKQAYGPTSPLTLVWFAILGSSMTMAQSANDADSARFQMVVCISNAVDQFDDGITQANEIGAVILRQPCFRYLKPIVDHTDLKQFGIARSQAVEMISKHWTDQATMAVLERRAKRTKQKDELRSAPETR